MRRLILAAAVSAAALSLGNAQAAPGPCTIAPGALDAGAECSYDATGPGTLTVLSPNDVNVTVTYVCDDPDTAEVEICTRQEIDAGGAAVEGQGQFAIASEAGDLVTVSVDMGCVDPAPICGHVGLIDARDDGGTPEPPEVPEPPLP